jgi:hypothetical protein
MKKYKTEMDKGRVRLEEGLRRELYSYIESIRTRMDAQFIKFDALIQQEESDLKSLTQDLKAVQIDLGNIRKAILKAI